MSQDFSFPLPPLLVVPSLLCFVAVLSPSALSTSSSLSLSLTETFAAQNSLIFYLFIERVRGKKKAEFVYQMNRSSGWVGLKM